MSSSSSYAWYPSSSVRDIDCLCLGTGRFLRSVLVPALVGAGLHPALIQTRGRSMLEYMQNSDEGVYEIDTVTPSGDVETTRIPIYGVSKAAEVENGKAKPKSNRGIKSNPTRREGEKLQ
jgi:hypothetical protein